MSEKIDFAVLGGGIVGLGTALSLLERKPGCRLAIFEKEDRCGAHQSTHNSGVLHAGLYYQPGSLKARLAVEGIRKMTSFCRDNGVDHEICGKIVVATNPTEEQRLKTLHERGIANGLTGISWLGKEELREREPHAAGTAALLVPEEGIVDYAGVCAAMAASIQGLGGEIFLSAKVTQLLPTASGWEIATQSSNAYSAGFLINCAGLYCDHLASVAGETPKTKIIPFRGEYFKLKPSASHLVNHLIYPVPDPEFPFLGVHFTRLIHGGIEAGPNAVLAMAREGYTKWRINPGELIEALCFPGLWKFMSRYKRMCLQELVQSLAPSLFVKALQKLVPAITLADIEPGGAGVRAQAMEISGGLVQDFDIISRDRALHVLNAPSPAATASLAIGEEIAGRIVAKG